MNKNTPLKWVEIRRSALRANLKTVQKCLNKNVRLMAVVKEDAYGHGAPEAARIALKQGAHCLGVLTAAEAFTLRRAGISGKIILLAPPLPEEIPAILKAELEPTIDSIMLLRTLTRVAKKPVSVHMDVDYGLGRWGTPPKDIPSLAAHIRKNKRLRLAGLSTHLDYVPGKNAVEAEDKLRSFNRLASKISAAPGSLIRHCANSSILLDFPHWQLDMVRIGNLFYGINPTSQDIPLKSPWRLRARITSLKEVRKGNSIGYASEYLAPRHMKVAALPIGYADGLTMEPAERLIGLGRAFRYWGMLKGKRVPFIGRCGISHVLVDVSSVSNVRIGEAVTLPIRRTSAGPRLPRIYI